MECSCTNILFKYLRSFRSFHESLDMVYAGNKNSVIVLKRRDTNLLSFLLFFAQHKVQEEKIARVVTV